MDRRTDNYLIDFRIVPGKCAISSRSGLCLRLEVKGQSMHVFKITYLAPLVYIQSGF
jgi:hypothetical protein